VFVCVLIEQNKLSKKAVIAGKPCNAAVNFEYGVLPKTGWLAMQTF